MKITEIVTESEIPQDQLAALSGMKKHESLQSSDPYHSYKFGVNLGGSPTFDEGFETDGPIGQSLITVAYSDGDEAIVDAVEKRMGIKSKRIGPRYSKEGSEVHKNSPVRDRGHIQLIKK